MSAAVAATSEWLRQAPLRLLLLATSVHLAHCLLPELTRQRLNQTFGLAILRQANLCEAELIGTSCNLASLLEDVGSTTVNARNIFDAYRFGIAFEQDFCDDFWQVMLTDMANWQEICGSLLVANEELEGVFPEECDIMVSALSAELNNPRFDVPVKCGIVSPGTNRERMPQCSALAMATVASQPTLIGSGCGSMRKDKCAQHFCDIYRDLKWWVRPRNLQMETYAYRYPQGFILPGCEDFDAIPWNKDECPQRLDINGLCDCFCHNMELMPPGPETAECNFNVNAYMVFGRLGVAGAELSTACEDSLCGLFNSVREGSACSFMRLPDTQDCLALKLPVVGSDTCQWLEDSGEVGVLECLDGHRCNIEEETWACCSEGIRNNHIGRGKCPQELPVMCDQLCGGDTDFCCMRDPGQCTPRDCTPFILKESPSMSGFSTSTTTTTDFVDNSEDPGLFDINIRIGRGSWVWLLLLIPISIGFAVLAFWYYGRLAGWHVPEGDDTMHHTSDKWGIFNIVRNTRSHHEKQIKGELVIIIMEDLPKIRPLGLELLETKVMRVHPRGAKFGWHVGDVIREVAGNEVYSFEEIWKRIQIERDCCPVKFLVERFDWSADAARPTTPPEMKAIKAMQRGAKANNKVGPLPANNATGTLGDTGLPSSVVGWETWAVAKGPEEPQSPQNAEEELQKGLKAAATTRQKEAAARRVAAARRREGAEEARKAWAEDLKRPPHERDGLALEKAPELDKTQTTLDLLNSMKAAAGIEDNMTDANTTLNLRDAATADRNPSKESALSVALEAERLTLEEEKAIADRVARTFHHKQPIAHAKQPKEEIRWFKDGWGRQQRVLYMA